MKGSLKELKKTPYKSLSKTKLTYEELNAVVMDIERHLNNHPLTYIESNGGEPRVLTPNPILWATIHIFLKTKNKMGMKFRRCRNDLTWQDNAREI